MPVDTRIGEPERRSVVRHRRVIYVHGYDLQGVEGYYGMFRNGLDRFQKNWPVRAELGPFQIHSDGWASWQVTTAGRNWQARTDYEFIRYDDVVAANMKRPILGQIVASLRWMLDDLVSGTTARIIRAAWRFELHFAVFQLVLLAWITLPIAAGVLGAYALWRSAILPASAAVIFATALAAALFFTLRPLAERWFVVRILNCWPHFRTFANGAPSCFDRSIETGAARVTAAVDSGDADEILVIGHSSGAPLALAMMARALERDSALGKRASSLMVLTLGSVMPAVALHPRAQRMREIVRRVAADPHVEWVDCQSRKDILNFWNFDPVAGLGIDVGPGRRKPVICQVRFRDALSDEHYRRLRRNFLRLHYQFVMAADQPAPYDYFTLTCGPVRAIDWARRGNEVLAAFPADGAFNELASPASVF